jgi:tetraacyldisaccharide-1-P 4'-kinase
VLITKVPREWRPLVAEIERVVDDLAPRAQVFVSRQCPSRVQLPGDGWQEPDVLDGRRVFAFAALGRPDGFVSTLAEAGAEVAATQWFPDHHVYSEDDLDQIVNQAASVAATPITTAKDAVKLPSDVPVGIVEATVEPVEGSWTGLWRLLPEIRE